jgi:uncharacterized UBP type Zn finger protein
LSKIDLKYADWTQEDALEVFITIFEYVEKILAYEPLSLAGQLNLAVPISLTEFLQLLFESQVDTNYRCEVCGAVTSKRENSIIVSLKFPEFLQSNDETVSFTLETILDYYFSEEILQADCFDCGTRNAEKKKKSFLNPLRTQYLILAFGRFGYCPVNAFGQTQLELDRAIRENQDWLKDISAEALGDFYDSKAIKHNILVQVPRQNLNLSKWTSPVSTGSQQPWGIFFLSLTPSLNPVIDLVAVLDHAGKSANSGHYTSSILLYEDVMDSGSTIETAQWYRFDDSSVSPIKENDVISETAYVVIYKKRD